MLPQAENAYLVAWLLQADTLAMVVHANLHWRNVSPYRSDLVRAAV